MNWMQVQFPYVKYTHFFSDTSLTVNCVLEIKNEGHFKKWNGCFDEGSIFKNTFCKK
jgi:hypothetical protein